MLKQTTPPFSLRKTKNIRLFLALGVWLTLTSVYCAAAERPNVLMILVDDLKPALGCYGDSIAKTPNIDALAARGMRFERAYCNQAVCAPSRFTLMLGSHSTSTGLYGLGSQLRQIVPDAVTISQHFAKHGGYHTESLRKVFLRIVLSNHQWALRVRYGPRSPLGAGVRWARIENVSRRLAASGSGGALTGAAARFYRRGPNPTDARRGARHRWEV